MIDVIVKGLNEWLAANYVGEGWFIGRQFEEGTSFNAIKNKIVEIYYHTYNVNYPIFKKIYPVNKTTSQYNNDDKLYSTVMEMIFSSLSELEDRIKSFDEDAKEIMANPEIRDSYIKLDKWFRENNGME